MNRVIKFAFLFGLVLLVFSGCASKPEAPVAQAPVEEKPTVNAPQVTKMNRELGSIWWDGSSWNQMYSGTTGRNVGDVILLKPTDGFKVAVAAKSGKGSGAELSSRENSNVIATVVEVLPRDIYRVEAKQRLTVGTKEHEMKLKGKVRERDIAGDDTVSTDVVFDLNLDVEGQKVETTQVASNATPEIQSEKPAEEKAKPVVHKPGEERMPDPTSNRQPTMEVER